MARDVVVTCDVCNKPDAVEWSVAQSGDGHWAVDLCPEHGGVILELVAKGREVAQTRPSGTGRKYSRYVRGLPPPGGKVDA